jgi:hypothetical protein
MISQNKIQITPAVVRLTQVYARTQQLSFRNRIARLIAEESILALDVQLDLCLDEGASLSEIDALARVIPVNDIVINSHHIDVAIIDSDSGHVALPVALAQSNYCRYGTLVVRLCDTTSGSIVGYIEPRIWLETAQLNKQTDEVECIFKSEPDFELERCLQSIFAKTASEHELYTTESHGVDLQAADYIHFLRDLKSIPLSKQKKIIDNCLADSAVRENMSALCEFENENLPGILSQSAAWESRLYRLAERLQSHHPEWQLPQLIELLRNMGNNFGGQPESPAFKLSLARTLLTQKGAVKLSTKVQGLADSLLEQLFAGKKVVDSVRQYVKNQIAVDIAAQIQLKRIDLLNFSQATTDEIAAAVRQLSLQPAYATHSQSESSALEDINEALQLFAIVKIGDELDHVLSEN